MSINGSSSSFLPYTLSGLTDATFSNSNIGNGTATTLQVTTATPSKIARFDANQYLVSAAVDVSDVALLAGGNTFNGNQILNNNLTLTTATANKIARFDASKNLVSSSIDTTDLALLSANNTWTGTNTFNNNLTVGTTYNANLSGLVRTELNNVLAGYTPASITVGNDFGTITNSLGVYQATSTTTFASLVLGSLTAGEKYSVSLSLKSVDVSNNTNLYLYGSTTPNMTGSTGQLAGFSIPPNTTGFTVFTNTITFPVGSTYLLLVYYSQKPSGIDTLYWNAFSVTGMGSVVKNLIAPSTGLDGANKAYVDTATALLVPYTGATTTVNLNSQNITTTRVPSGVSDLTNKTYVDGAISAASLLPLNNTWTGTNTFNNTLSAFNNQFSVVSTDVGYTGASFTASTGIGSITYSAPTYTANSSASVQGIITLPALSAVYVNNPCVATFTNLSFPLFAVAPYPYFTLTSGSTVVYTSAVNPSGTITMSFTPTSATLFITLYFKAPPTGISAPIFSWNTFTMSSYTATAPKLIVNGKMGIGTTTPTNTLTITQSSTSDVPTMIINSPAPDSAIDINCTATGGRNYRIGSAGTGTGAGVGNFFIYDATASTTRMVIDSAGEVGIGTLTPTKKLAVYQALGIPSITSAQDFPAQLTLESGSSWLKLGQYYQAGVGTWGVIQSSDYYSSAEHGCNLGLNPLNGKVSIGGEQMSGTAVRSPAQAIGRLTINADYADSGSGFCINASDSNSTDTYYMNLYPYVVGGGIVGYNFFIGNNSNPYNPLSLNRDRVGINNTAPVANFQANGTASICGGSNFANAMGYMTTGSLTVGDTTRNYGGGFDWNSNTAGLLFECADNTEIAVHDAGARVASFMNYLGAQNTFYMGRLMGTGWGNATYVYQGILQSSVQPRCRLYGSGNAVAQPVGATWGANTLFVGQSEGMSNVAGNGWYSAGGIFYAPQTGRYQINITFYWNTLIAGNRVILRFYTSGGVALGDQYCCIEGGGIGADTVRQYSTMLLMPAGSYFYISMASGSNGSVSYFSGYEHSQMSIYMVH